MSLQNLSPRESQSRVASPSPPPSFYHERNIHSPSSSPSRTQARRIQFAAPPPPIVTSVVLPPPNATYQAHHNFRGSLEALNGGRSSSPRMGRGGGGIDPLLGLERREKAIQDDLQLLLDAQSAGLIQGFGGDAAGGDGSSEAGSSTPTTRSQQRSSSRGRSGGILPVRQPRRKVIGLRSARRGLLRDLGELVAVKKEQVGILTSEVQRRDEALAKLDAWENNMKEVRGKLSGYSGPGGPDDGEAGGEETQEIVEFRTEEAAVENEIREVEDRLAQMKARKRWLGERIKECTNRRDARLSSYRGALREIEAEVKEFLRRPPVPVPMVMGGEEGFTALPANRRTLGMAREWWSKEISQLKIRQEEVEREKLALQEGAQLWEESIRVVSEFEDGLRKQMASTDVQDPEMLRKQIDNMGDVIQKLSSTVRIAEDNGWNLLICAVGAEREAFKEGQEILRGALDMAQRNDPEGAVGKSADDFRNGAEELKKPPERRRGHDTESEDDGPNLAELCLGAGPPHVTNTTSANLSHSFPVVEMPFNFPHSHSRSTSQQENAFTPGASSGILQAAQQLGSFGAPSGNLNAVASSRASGGTDRFLPSSRPSPSAGILSHSNSASSSPHGLQQLQSATTSAPSAPSASGVPSQGQGQRFEMQRLSQHADELHMNPSADNMASQRGPMSPRDYTPGGPRISLEQATPEALQYQSVGQQLPGSLQPGRPGPMSANNAPSMPTASQTMSQEQYTTPSRSSTLGLSHNYTRSSPAAGFEGQGYAPFTPTTPSGGNDFTSPTNQKYTPQNNQRTVSNTPLGLADIRPRADSGLSEGIPGANPYSYDGANAVPTNSNYLAPWAIYAFDWCKWPAHNHDAGKVAVGSYLEDGHNFIQILDSQITPTPSESYVPGAPKYGLDFVKIAEATHSYPVTRLLWEPPSSQKQSTDLLATSGDHLRLWSLPSETPAAPPGNSISRPSNHGRDLPASKLTPLALLSNSKTPEHTAPLTSLDWNTVSPSLIITSSIDTTCTIWDIPTLTAKTQLIAHDKEVFDVRFCANSVDVFVSCGADGSVRMFDLRSLEHSTIIYEPSAKDDKGTRNRTINSMQANRMVDNSPGGGRISPTLAQQTMSNAPPLLRLAASPHDTHLLATFSQDSSIIRILDVRQPGQALLELRGHGASINCIDWSPSRRGTLASGADDSLVLIWDLLSQSTALAPPGPAINGAPVLDNTRGPTASWQCDYEVGNISWAPHSALNNDGGDWLGVSGGRGIWGVKL
ncbi:WD domain-containing protein [Diplocarpon rosae]|nr:WD domain-containing protein [Diplocarpon rosae]